jgi:cell division transport system permease protein
LILPSISFLVVQNLKSISETIQHESQITIFLKKDISADAKNKIEKELKSRNEINNYHYVKKEEAWPKLQKSMGFNESNNGLSDNPLPDAFFVSPNTVNPNQIVILKSFLDRLEGIDQVVVDTGWVKKLNSLLHLANKAIFLASILLASMLTMVIGNTIRLQMTSHHEEIELSKLIETFKIKMSETIGSSNLCSIFGFDKEISPQSIDRANRLLIPYIKNLVNNKLTELTL